MKKCINQKTFFALLAFALMFTFYSCSNDDSAIKSDDNMSGFEALVGADFDILPGEIQENNVDQPANYCPGGMRGPKGPRFKQPCDFDLRSFLRRLELDETQVQSVKEYLEGTFHPCVTDANAAARTSMQAIMEAAKAYWLTVKADLDAGLITRQEAKQKLMDYNKNTLHPAIMEVRIQLCEDLKACKLALLEYLASLDLDEGQAGMVGAAIEKLTNCPCDNGTGNSDRRQD